MSYRQGDSHNNGYDQRSGTSPGSRVAPGKRTLTEQLPARLPDSLRARVEQSFGADFSSVRLHESGDVESAGALAHTRGNDIHFRLGGFDLGSEHGLELLGHELTHVVQQRSGRIDATQPKAALGAQRANLEASLESEADRAAGGSPAAKASRCPCPPSAVAPPAAFRSRSPS